MFTCQSDWFIYEERFTCQSDWFIYEERLKIKKLTMPFGPRVLFIKSPMAIAPTKQD